MIGVYAVAVKMIGPITPIGKTEVDAERLENLKTMTLLVDRLIWDIANIAANKNRVEYSLKMAGELADRFMKGLGSNWSLNGLPTHTYSWGNNPKRATLKGRKCVIIWRFKNRSNSILVRFENGQIECVSRRALRKWE